VNYFRSRLAIVLIGLTLTLLALPSGATVSASEDDESAAQALQWLIDQQGPDGGFPGFEGESEPGATADAIVALAAAGGSIDRSGDVLAAALDFLESSSGDYAETQAGAAKTILAVHAAGGEPGNFGNEDLVGLLQDRADPDTGTYDEQLFIHATALLAIGASGEAPVDGAVDAVVERQTEDGSWAFSGETEPGTGDTNTTAMAIQALVALDVEAEDAIDTALDYLSDAQLEDGSVVYSVGAEDPPVGDSNSTALALQAMLAAGPDAESDQVQSATDALVAFQNDSGALGYRADMPEDNALSTAQGIPAMLHLTLPVDPHSDSGEVALDSASISDAMTPAEPLDDDVCHFYEITGHNLCHGFKDYWEGNGALPIYGYPLTEEFDDVDDEGSHIVAQYFERARFEYHPEAVAGERISVTPLGQQTAENLEQTEILDTEGPCETPVGSDHAVCAEFLTYWDEFGGEAVFGLPISDAFDSDGMKVQIFEYARFEHQPGEWPERYDVLLGRIGSEVLVGQVE
jgi:hypothetical protein